MTTLSLTAGILPAQSLSRSQWRVVSLASLGGSLEYYDFIIYSIFAQYIARQFFPTNDPFVSLILAFSVLTLGFLARPLERQRLDHVGDHRAELAGRPLRQAARLLGVLIHHNGRYHSYRAAAVI